MYWNESNILVPDGPLSYLDFWFLADQLARKDYFTRGKNPEDHFIFIEELKIYPKTRKWMLETGS